MTNLSLAAQMVLDALYMEELNGPQQLMARAHAAAALRAAVKFTRKEKMMKTLGVTMAKSQAYCLESDLLAIATELEAQ
jgi:hypothetical protein